VHFPGPLLGRPLWVDDDRFDIHQHVYQTAVDPPGGDTELLDAAVRICGGLLDRARPLWELWFLTGLTGGRVGVLLKLHHSVADGIAAVAVMASLFDTGPGTPSRLPSPGHRSAYRQGGSSSPTTSPRSWGRRAVPLPRWLIRSGSPEPFLSSLASPGGFSARQERRVPRSIGALRRTAGSGSSG